MKTIFALIAFAAAVFAAEPPLPAEERSKLIADLASRIAALDSAIARTPGNADLFSRRGDARLFLARFAEAVAGGGS